MPRKIIAITGTRSDYGLMSPVYEEIARHSGLDLELVVTGMHLLPEFAGSLQKVEQDRFGKLHYVKMLTEEDSGMAMAQGLGRAIVGFAPVFADARPDLALLQGDRGEMLAGAIAAAHMNIPVIHMSGGDRSGTIDDPVRNAISKFAHVHLTTCAASSENLLRMGEDAKRIIEVGEPGLDVIRTMQYLSREELAAQFGLDPAKPIVVVAQHPVTTEAAAAGAQMTETLEAVRETGLQAVCTYPNSDAGGREMLGVLESYRSNPLFRIEANLGAQRFLSLLRAADVLVGNSSSGIFEAPSFKRAAVNIGTRQHGRTRASNVIDVAYDRKAIADAIQRALSDAAFRAGLEDCVNPYGDGHTAPRVADILARIRITSGLLAKWIAADDPLLD
jgi:UDP-N-acetylglucosamine 2-epimerase (non-hydrolysing)/GDP/UDP-N,N'-diacetylbacillosamine 2-epimerase (hydrolysing)